MNSLSPPLKNGAFMIRNNKYNLRNFQCLFSTNKRTVKYGTETVTYRGPQIWNLVPEKTKYASLFDSFKREIRKCKGEKCPCRICKTYFQHVGFVLKILCFLKIKEKLAQKLKTADPTHFFNFLK